MQSLRFHKCYRLAFQISENVDFENFIFFLSSTWGVVTPTPNAIKRGRRDTDTVALVEVEDVIKVPSEAVLDIQPSALRLLSLQPDFQEQKCLDNVQEVIEKRGHR